MSGSTKSLPDRPVTTALGHPSAMAQAREALDKATTPEEVQTVRANLQVLRAVLAAALHDPGATAEDVAAARRELEEMALDAAVKLGSMVPAEGAPGARTDLGSTSATVAEVAKRAGLSRDTLRRYRELASAFRANESEFMSIAKGAIGAGQGVPMKQLLALAPKPQPPEPPAQRPSPTLPPALVGKPAGEVLGRVFSAIADAQAALSVPEAESEKSQEVEPEEKEEEDEGAYLPVDNSEDRKRHATALEAALRHCLLLSVDVDTPTLSKLTKNVTAGVGKIVKTGNEIVGWLREIAAEEKDVVKSERERLTKIHREAKAERKRAGVTK